MIKVTLMDMQRRENYIVDPATTVSGLLEEKGFAASSQADITIDGFKVAPEDLGKSFADLGVRESCRVCSVLKAKNA